MDEILELTGTVVSVIYTNEENGYTVCDVESAAEGYFTAVGYLPYIMGGEHVRLTGTWVTHPDYGEQFKVSCYEMILPEDEEAILQYLSTGIVKGVRETTAKKLVDHFGRDVLNIMLNEPARLAEIKGITQKKALAIGEAFFKIQSMQGIVMFLQQYGVSAKLALKVHRVLGAEALDKVKQNPYILSACVDGISFKTADNIAFVRGVAKNSPERIHAGLLYMLKSAAYTAGHTYLPKTLLIEHAAHALEITEQEAENGITALSLEREMYIDTIRGMSVCYLSAFLSAEQYIARRLASLSLVEQKPFMSEEALSDLVEEIAAAEKITLAPEQMIAVQTAVTESCMVITGGPGTGKTTTINAIIKVMQELKLSVALAAPTGRAAKRMSEVTGLEAKTIHRLLGVQPDGEDSQTFSFNEENPLKADVLILDEMSMVDVPLMHAFLRAVKRGARVILAGDADQLPSVGPGNVLRDMISSEMIPVIRLEQIFRQAQESLIVTNAHRINRGDMPELWEKNKDFFFLRRNGAEEAAKEIVNLYKYRLPKSYQIDAVSEIQVLSPSKKGKAGVQSLNQVLQQEMNPPAFQKTEYVRGKMIFRERDKVMQIKNNYDLSWKKDNGEQGSGIFNGDMGMIQSISTKDKEMVIRFDDRTVSYPFSSLEELDLAYAVTVHKSQGSEFPIVLLPVCRFAPMLMMKNLLYTAVTRAKKMVILVGSEQAVEQMVKSGDGQARYTGLSDKLIQIKGMLESDEMTVF